MNSDLDAFAAEAIAAANRWQSSAQDELAAIAAYHDFKEHEKHMSKEQPPLFVTSGDTRLILAGTHACSLALLVLDNKPKHPLALAVLDDWGLESKELTKEDVPTPEPELVWPPVDLSGRPLASSLNPKYFETRYRVRENDFVSKTDNLSGVQLMPVNLLTLHDAYWDEGTRTWRLQLSIDGVSRFWKSHCNIKPDDSPSPVPNPFDGVSGA